MSQPTSSPQFEEAFFHKGIDNLKKGSRPKRPENGAGNGVRTRDTKLGKLVLYQLSYARPVPFVLSLLYLQRERIFGKAL